jgi:hypothetical protein
VNQDTLYEANEYQRNRHHAELPGDESQAVAGHHIFHFSESEKAFFTTIILHRRGHLPL